MQILHALERFRVQLQADGRSPLTIAQYERHVGRFAEWLRGAGRAVEVEVEALDHEDVAAFLASPDANERADGGMKTPGSVNALRASIRGFFSYLHQGGYAPANAARLVRRARCGPTPPKSLTEDEQRRLFAVLGEGDGQAAQRDRMLFSLMLASGLRLGAALGLDVEDLDLADGSLVARRTKGSRPERVLLPNGVAAELAGFVEGRIGPVFVGRDGSRLGHRQAQRRFARWCEIAGIERTLHPHALRHTFATRLYRRTGDVLLVKEALRHRSLTSTMVYARCDEGRLRAALGA